MNGAGDDGLLQRFQLVVWPDIGRDWEDVDRWPDSKARNTAYAVFERLDTLNPTAVGAVQEEVGEIPYVRFSPDAQEEFSDWRHRLEIRLRSDRIEHPAFEAHLAKYRSLIPSLALLIHLADSPDAGAVDIGALLRACAWGEYLESHARRLYAPALSPDVVAAQTLDKHIRRGNLPDPFTAREVSRKNWSGLHREDDVSTLFRTKNQAAFWSCSKTSGAR